MGTGSCLWVRGQPYRSRVKCHGSASQVGSSDVPPIDCVPLKRAVQSCVSPVGIKLEFTLLLLYTSS